MLFENEDDDEMKDEQGIKTHIFPKYIIEQSRCSVFTEDFNNASDLHLIITLRTN